MKNRLFLLFIIAMVLTGAQTVSATELGTGLKEPEVIELPSSEMLKENDRETAAQSNYVTESDWEKYKNYYYYNQLEPSKKAAWDELDEICEEYLLETKDVSNFYNYTPTGETTEVTWGYIEDVTFAETLTKNELKEFWCMYIYANPQYYFLCNSYLSYGSGDAYSGIALVVYDAFWDGTARAEATAKVEAQLSAWQTEIDACTTEAAKLQKIQDLICAKVTYNYDAANNLVDEQVSFSQSPYSLICGDSTVCAGYADTFSMLCNASGIDTISVTSSNHQWNKVRINDSWYNFDPTWDDNYTDSWGYPVYRYYGRSDAMYDTDINNTGDSAAGNIAAHQEEEYWETYLPLCTFDSAPDSTFKTPGTFATISNQAAIPEITISYVNGEPQVALGCATENVILYYTTDGTNPAVAKSKAYKYSAPFAAEIDTQIKAIAVCDTYLDSEVAAKVVELEKYVITYVLDGGVNSSENPANYTVRDEVVLQSPTKAGYKFLGWYLDEDGTEQTSGIEAGSIGPCVFYALWSPITYSVSYDGNGATDGSMSDKNGCVYDTAYTLAENNYVRTGYTFAGWNTEADGSGIAYADEASVNNLTTVDGSKATLYAQWSPITYSISFDGNGATTGEMELIDNCSYGKTYALTANGFAKTGYAFDGWNEEADGSGASYKDEAAVKNLTSTDGATITLYARWRVIVYDIAFIGNGATSGEMSPISDCTYNVNYTLVENSYERTGYTFAGWNTEADGSGTKYAENASVKNLTLTDGETVTLYAQWDPITYGIAYDGNGATGGDVSGLSDCIYDTTYTLAESNYERTGYLFAGWNTEKDGSGDEYAENASVNNLATTAGETAILYAQWKPISYNIGFDGNGATDGSMSAQSNCEYDMTYSLVANNYEKLGYIFAGWNTEQYGLGESYVDEASVKNLTVTNGDSVVLYAQWSPITYEILYDGNGATGGTMSAQSGCEYDMFYALEENNYERTGYIFSGWNTKSDGSGTEYSDGDEIENLTAINDETVTLYAQWSPITYNISYDGNGAEGGTMSEHSGCKYDEEYKLFANAYVKKGYALKCWNTELDNSGTAFVDEALVKNLTATDGANVMLYAQWRLLEYSISYDGNGATAGSMAVKSGCQYNKEYVLDANDYERTGYTFAGWNTEADGSGAAYSDEAAIKNLVETDGATITLYAQWSPITYGISYDGNGATDGTMSEQGDCEYEKEYELASNNYTRTGYTFAGWNTKADGSGTSYADEALVKNLATKDGATATLYAQWSPILYTILFDGNGATGGEMEEQSGCAYDASVTLKANAYVKAGNGFKSWNTKPDGSGMTYMDEASVKNLAMVHGETVTLYAQWGVGKYSISYDGNGATEGTMTVKKGCEYGVEYLLDANNYKRTGYTFAGWNTKADGSGTSYADFAQVKNLTNINGGVVVLYAQWKINTYSIRYDGNKSTKGSMSSQPSLVYGKSYQLLANKFKRTGYKFTGWNTQKDGKGTSYKNKTSVQNLSSKNGEVVTLYAQWKANTYKIKFNGNGATSGSMKKTKKISYGKKYRLSANKFKKDGYKFVGWNTKKNGKGKMYKNKAKIKNLTSKNGKTVTLYAQWKKI